MKTILNLWKQWWNFWAGPIDPIRLDTFRLLIGISLFCYIAAWWQHAAEWLTPVGFHVSPAADWSSPDFLPLPVGWLPLFGVLYFGSILAWTLGIATPWTTWLTLAGTIYVTFVDVFSAYTLNKFYIIILSIFACTKSATYWTPFPKAPRLRSAWALRIFQLTLVVHYFITGYTKAFRGDWLQNPNTLWSQIQGLYMTDFAAWLLNHLPLGCFSWMQYAALSFEIFSPILFIVPALRPLGILWGFTFQMLVAVSMEQLIYFSFQMICFYVLFIEERTLHAVRLASKNFLSSLSRQFDALAGQIFSD